MPFVLFNDKTKTFLCYERENEKRSGRVREIKGQRERERVRRRGGDGEEESGGEKISQSNICEKNVYQREKMVAFWLLHIMFTKYYHWSNKNSNVQHNDDKFYRDLIYSESKYSPRSMNRTHRDKKWNRNISVVSSRFVNTRITFPIEYWMSTIRFKLLLFWILFQHFLCAELHFAVVSYVILIIIVSFQRYKKQISISAR